MKAKFIYLLLGAIVVLSSAFSPAKGDVPEKIGKYLKVTMKKQIVTPTGIEEKVLETFELRNYTTQMRADFVKTINKKYGITGVMYSCIYCSSCVCNEHTGKMMRTCCYIWAELVQCFEEECGPESLPCN